MTCARSALVVVLGIWAEVYCVGVSGLLDWGKYEILRTGKA
jgi:hypothetical protein